MLASAAMPAVKRTKAAASVVRIVRNFVLRKPQTRVLTPEENQNDCSRAAIRNGSVSKRDDVLYNTLSNIHQTFVPNVQYWIENDNREEHDPLNENETDTDGEATATFFTTMEESMIEQTMTGTLPLISGET